jgi:hypothetical protein
MSRELATERFSPALRKRSEAAEFGVDLLTEK